MDWRRNGAASSDWPGKEEVRNMSRIIGALVVAVTLFMAGCAFKATSGNPIGSREVSAIRKGVTTRQEIVNMLGSPQLITRLEGRRERHTYVLQDSETSIVNLAILTVVSVSGKARSLIVTYDENGVVTTHEFVAGVQMPTRSVSPTPAVMALF